MRGKVRQITDSIHGTIYVSELEYELMSTPYFYRLHDVYQSSTVYMTFPSNRTKRYEHSLGTMELAGQMFYSAVTNASLCDQRKFLRTLENEFKNLHSLVTNRQALEEVPFYRKVEDDLEKLIPSKEEDYNNFLELLYETMRNKPLNDKALCKQEVCFFNTVERDQESKETTTDIYLFSFLYQCTLEALRVAALFHDIGHPPFSHIIESLIEELAITIGKPEMSEQWDPQKVHEFEQCVSKYVQNKPNEKMLMDQISSYSSNPAPAFHESVGRHLLYHSFGSVLKMRLKEWAPHYEEKVNKLKALYLLCVIEFAFAILLEKNEFFSSLHRIVDGVVDADRLDYVARDSQNAGMDWGIPPYTRIISAIKFAYEKETLVLAFPEKISDDIDDLFVTRYKIFQRINYHHRVVKTAELLRRSVSMLAEDYFLSKVGDEILPEIVQLWGSLGATFGQDESETQISQWTDSWLISALNIALHKLNNPSKFSFNLYCDRPCRTKEDINRLRRMLEEVLLNRKQYFPLLKRHNDALDLAHRVRAEAGITEDTIKKIYIHEHKKYLRECSDQSTHPDEQGFSSASEAIWRLDMLQNKILDRAQFDLLDSFFPGHQSYFDIIRNTLDEEKKSKTISDYFLWINTGYKKYGISNDSAPEDSLPDDLKDNQVNNKGLFFYPSDKKREIKECDLNVALVPKLEAERSSALWLFLCEFSSKND